MTETMERKSNLAVPQGWYELDREEMSYVDGGLYLPNWFCSGVTFLTASAGLLGAGFATAATIGGKVAMVSAFLYASSYGIKALGAKVLSGIGALALAHPVLAGLAVGVFAFAIYNKESFFELGYNIVKAGVSGCGVDINVSWFNLSSNIC